MGLARAIGLRRSERLHERGHVMAVHFARIPAEGLELRCEIARIAHIGRVAVDLQAVAVHDGHQVVEVAMRREHGSLPYLPFLAFAVAEQGEHGLRLAVQLETGRGARRDGQALAERARGHLDARHEVRVGMALQARAQLAQREQLLAGEVARLGEHGVQSRSRMALRQDEAVALIPIGSLGIMIEHSAEVQRRKDVGARQRPAGMPAARLRDHAHDVGAHLVRPPFKFGHACSFLELNNVNNRLAVVVQVALKVPRG